MNDEPFDYQRQIGEDERRQMEETQAEWSERFGRESEEHLRNFLKLTRWEWETL